MSFNNIQQNLPIKYCKKYMRTCIHSYIETEKRGGVEKVYLKQNLKM